MRQSHPVSLLFYLSCLLIISQTTLYSAPPPEKFPAAWQNLLKVYDAELARGEIVGSSLLFIQGDKIIGEAHRGWADRETQRQPDLNTIYHWASITKTFTAIAIMQLRDRGKLNLDDPIVTYIPELEKVHNPYGDMRDITLRHLMSHSAGFRAGTWPWGGDQPWHPYEPTEFSQVAAMFPYTEILFPPGSRYRYSNLGIIFLGRVIEILSGDDYEVYIDKNILKPLGMTWSYFDVTPYHLLPYRSNNYFIRDTTITANGLDFDTGITVSNGGLNSPIKDMLKYLRFLNGVKSDAFPVLERQSLEELWQPQVFAEGEADPKRWMGLSFFLIEKDGIKLIGHTGSQQGFISFFYVHPPTQTAVICNFNTLDLPDEGDTRTGQISLKMQRMIFETIFPLFQDN